MSSIALTRAIVAALGLSTLAASLVRSMDEGVEPPAALSVTVRDGHGRPLAARVDITPLGAPAEPSAWPPSPTRLRTAGSLRTSLPRGRYEIRVTHGPRHELVRRTLQLDPGPASLDVVLNERVKSDGYECVDLHVHTDASPDHHGGVGGLDLEAEGLDLALATDHNHAGAPRGGALPALAGVELTTWAPEIGHFNAFPVGDVPSHVGRTPPALFAALRARGDVFVQVNHPRLDDHIAYFTLGALRGTRFREAGFTLQGVDGVEVWNGYDIARPEAVLRVLEEVTRFHARGARLVPTGGSDSHGAPAHLPGYPRTCVRRRPDEPLARALVRGDVYVTNGPTVVLRVNGRPPGETVEPDADGRVRARVQVRAHPALTLGTVELWADGERVHSTPWQRPAADAPFVVEAPIAVASARSVHARVIGGAGLAPFVGRSDAPPLAFSAPVYVRAGRLSETPRD
jgi:hypothetical protein